MDATRTTKQKIKTNYKITNIILNYILVVMSYFANINISITLKYVPNSCVAVHRWTDRQGAL